MNRRKLIVFALMLPAVAAAQSGTRNVPGSGVITAPGHYILANDMSILSHGSGISIMANDVKLDLNGNTVRGPGGNTGTGILIRNARGVQVSNGFVVNNAFGVIVENSANVTLKGLQIRAEGLAVTAPPPETGIMIVQSKNVVVTGNSIFNTGLGIFVRGGGSSGNRIEGNTVTAGSNALLGICYNPAPGDPMGPRGDLVRANLISGFGVGIQMSASSMANVTQENTIVFRVAAVDFQNMTNLDINNAKVQAP